MTDLDRRLESAASAIHRAASHVPTDPASIRHSRDPRHSERGPSSRLGLIAAASIALVSVAGLVLIERGPDHDGSDPTTGASATAVTTDAAPTIKPLGLATAPNGLRLAWQGIRPAGGEALPAGVFVKRDAQDNVVNRVIVRLGAVRLYEGDLKIKPPPNLTTATSGDISISPVTVRVEYGLGKLGNLSLDALYADPQTASTLTDQMQQLAASLDIAAGRAIALGGPLPAGWTLAAVGVEPEQSSPGLFQAFEVDTADGGAKVTIENRMINNPDYPYWAMPAQTLQPIQIRGHAGFVTVQAYSAEPVPSTPGAPEDANPTSSASTLIWEEAPGHWVTMWAADRSTEQAVSLADTLVAVDTAQWHMPGGATGTTTTSLPVP